MTPDDTDLEFARAIGQLTAQVSTLVATVGKLNSTVDKLESWKNRILGATTLVSFCIGVGATILAGRHI